MVQTNAVLVKIGHDLECLIQKVVDRLEDRDPSRPLLVRIFNELDFLEQFNTITRPISLSISRLVVDAMLIPNAGFITNLNGKPVSQATGNELRNSVVASIASFNDPYTILTDPSVRRAILQLKKILPVQTDNESIFRSVRYSLWITAGLFIKGRDGKRFLSVREIVAILMHEIGHFIYTYRAMLMLCYTNSIFNRTITYATQTHSVAEVKELLSICLSIQNLSKTLRVYGQALLKTNISETDEIYPAYCAAVGWFVTVVNGTVSRKFFDTALGPAAIRVINDDSALQGKDQRVLNERYADSTAIAAGYGAEQTTAMSKLALSMHELYLNGEFLPQPMTGFAIGILDTLAILFGEDATYDPLPKRLRLLIDGAKEQLQIQKMDAEERAAMVKAITIAEEDYDLVTNTGWIKARTKLWTMFETIGNGMEFIPNIFTSTERDFAQQTHQILQSFRNNGLTFIAEELKLLTK